MRIGVKLEIGFAEQGAWRTLAGGRDVLALLRALGVSAVRPRSGETDGSALARHLRLCEEAGLVVSLHPYSEGAGRTRPISRPMLATAVPRYIQVSWRLQPRLLCASTWR